MDRKAIEEQAASLIGRALLRSGVELVDVTYRLEGRRWILRVFIDKPGGVSLEDCARVSHRIEDVIEVEDIIPHRYYLEVSSPGLDRVLKREGDFQRFRGRSARIRTRQPVGGRKNFKGRILGCERGVVEILDRDGRKFAFSMDEIETARLESRENI